MSLNKSEKQVVVADVSAQAARPEAKPAQMAVPPHSSSRNGVPGRKVAEPGVPEVPRGPEGTQ